MVEKFGSVVCNWKTLTMDFDWNNRKRRLQGLGAQTIQASSLNEVTKEIKQRQTIFAICLHISKEYSYAKPPVGMRGLLEEYSELFQEPKHLPPARSL